MRFDTQLRAAFKLIDTCKPDTALSQQAKMFFRSNRQLGSRDRKIILALAYSFFRLGKALCDQSTEARCLSGLFLSERPPLDFLSYFKPAWIPMLNADLLDKLKFIQQEFSDFRLRDVFPWTSHLSKEIDKERLLLSFFQQPKIFIRLRRNKIQDVEQILQAEKITYEPLSATCFTLEQGEELHYFFKDGQERLFEIQDYSSQLIENYYDPSPKSEWWDCCAGSGGKSLMLVDQEPSVRLWVSDIRPSILENLDKRFHGIRYKNYRKEILDLTKPLTVQIDRREFDGIIFDAPCTGSGTWGRTPERMSFFDMAELGNFAGRQREIARNIVPFLKKGKMLVYSTCSVFKEENEELVEYMVKELGLEMERMDILKGYEHRADTMFAAQLLKT